MTCLAVPAYLDAAAQNVGGTVRSAGGEVLAGASVYWADTSVGVACDADGAYTIHRDSRKSNSDEGWIQSMRL